MRPPSKPALCKSASWASALALMLAVAGCSRAEDPPAPPRLEGATGWVVITPQGAEARIASADGACPTAQINGAASPMTVRAPASTAFPTICSLKVPAGTARLDIDGKPLPLPHGTPNRIVIVGDTGCRVKGLEAQGCNDPEKWQFPRVAAAAAREAPDLVIHVGDYYYREAPCPAGRTRCAGSPYGDRWNTWRAELLDPAAVLLQTAPAIFVRGNHEDCSRAGRGWRRLLDTGDWGPDCVGLSDPVILRVGALSFGLLDSSAAEDRFTHRWFQNWFTPGYDKMVRQMGPAPNFLLTHRPIWAVVPVLRLGPLGVVTIPINESLQSGVKHGLPPGTELIISGHIHNFGVFSFGPERPAQLVAGEGGDLPLRSDSPAFDRGRYRIDGMTAEKLSFARYGYALMVRQPDPSGDRWRVEAHDADGRLVVACILRGRVLDCPAGR